MPTSTRPRHGFTLVELLVVISIIALLIGILLPALGRARSTAQRSVIQANMRAIGQAVATYNTENREKMPFSYRYLNPISDNPSDTPDAIQVDTNAGQYEYVHWSQALFDDGSAPPDAFKSPAVDGGGAPRTNPGDDINDWDTGQVDDRGGTAVAEDWEDYQAPRIAYGGNGAIFPRNKVSPLINSLRRNIEVRSTTFNEATSNLILASEFLHSPTLGWRTIGVGEGGADDANATWKSKSHRSLTPFLGGSLGARIYDEPTGNRGGFASFVYPDPDSDILSEENAQRTSDLIDPESNSSTPTSLNAVTRQHNGSAHHVFVDGHVELVTLRKTILRRMWGTRFYSISGNNQVSNEFVFGGRRFDEIPLD